ncbi:unnamed protein product [Microthlaspi erraticum]|uniref:Uncharacterized protein n=1 Tax=Microthlaspi erraticum TaxID=1685480 RepID=A0A6D2JL23_9BRAS|nr:unnamed protein product [Microthlaspi erraticum]
MYQSLPRRGKSTPSEGVTEDFNFQNTEEKAQITSSNVTPPIINLEAHLADCTLSFTPPWKTKKKYLVGKEVMRDPAAFDDKTSGSAALLPDPLGNSEDIFLETPPQKENTRRKLADAIHYNVGEEFTDPAPNRCSGIDAGFPNNGGIGLRKGLRMVDHYGYEEIGPIYNDMASDSLRLAEIDLTYEDDSIYCGRLFKNKEHLK